MAKGFKLDWQLFLAAEFRHMKSAKKVIVLPRRWGGGVRFRWFNLFTCPHFSVHLAPWENSFLLTILQALTLVYFDFETNMDN